MSSTGQISAGCNSALSPLSHSGWPDHNWDPAKIVWDPVALTAGIKQLPPPQKLQAVDLLKYHQEALSSQGNVLTSHLEKLSNYQFGCLSQESANLQPPENLADVRSMQAFDSKASIKLKQYSGLQALMDAVIFNPAPNIRSEAHSEKEEALSSITTPQRVEEDLPSNQQDPSSSKETVDFKAVSMPHTSSAFLKSFFSAGNEVTSNPISAFLSDVESLRDNSAAYQRSSEDTGKAPRPGHKLCQVPGCSASLATLKSYHRQRRICDKHLKEPEVIIHGTAQRFCQQCGSFHDLSKFQGKCRSCINRLLLHKQRRRRNRSAVGETHQQEDKHDASTRDSADSKPKSPCDENDCTASLEIQSKALPSLQPTPFLNKAYESETFAGQLLVKLLGQKPSSLPVDLRKRLLEWAECAPVWMAGQIRPGCVFLSVELVLPRSGFGALTRKGATVSAVAALADGFKDGIPMCGHIQFGDELALVEDGRVESILRIEAATCSSQATNTINDRIIVPRVNSVSPLVLHGTGPHAITLRGYGITGKLITLRIGGNCYTLPSAMAQGNSPLNRGQEEEVSAMIEGLHDCWIDGGLAACAWVEVHCAHGLGTSSAMPVLVATEEVAEEACGLNDLPQQEAAAMARDLVEVLRPRPGGLPHPQAQLLHRTGHKLGVALLERGLPRLAMRVLSAEHPSPEAECMELVKQEASRVTPILGWPRPVHALEGKMLEWMAPKTLVDKQIPCQALRCTVPRMCTGPLPMGLRVAPLCMA